VADATAINAEIVGVTCGKGLFVAADSGGGIYTSVDGQNWSPQANLNATVNGIAFGGGIFLVAAEDGEVFRSTNGLQWASRTTGLTGDFEAVTYGEGRFVLVADDGTAATTTNGNQWTLTLDSPTSNPLYGVAYGNNLFVAVGYLGTILTSPDGSHWSLQTNTILASRTLSGVAWGCNQFVAVGDGGWIMRSPDATNWVSSGSATINPLYSVIYANGRFIATGAQGTIIETAAAVTPQLAAARLANGSVQITVQGVPNTSYALWVSSDLVHWTQLVTVTLRGASGVFVDSVPEVCRFYRATLLP